VTLTAKATPGTGSGASAITAPVNVTFNTDLCPVVSVFAGGGTSGEFTFPIGIAVDSSNNAYVADTLDNSIRKIDASAVVTTFAGETQGYANGTGQLAEFNRPYGIAVDSNGNVYVADTYNNVIRKVTPSQAVTTFAGEGSAGYGDGTGTAAYFDQPAGVAVDSSGNVYVADGSNYIRKISPSAVVTTIAGNGTAGYADGAAASAEFDTPYGVAVDSSGNVYVADTYNNRIRKISTSGTVSTVAGSTSGYLDSTGTSAEFNYPAYLIFDSSGNLYVSDSGNNAVRKVTTAGVVTTLATVRSPYGIAITSTGDLLVVNSSGCAIDKINFE